MSRRAPVKANSWMPSNGLLTLLLVATMHAAQAGAASPEIFNRRCGVCHMPNGAGVPGAFPPLRRQIPALAASAAGRDYLVAVLTYGRSGGLLVDGTAFNGVMPPQSLNDADTAEVLNYTLDGLNARGTDTRLFSAEEVAAIRKRISVSDMNATAALRPDVP